jgi:hypothetical protein
MIGKDGHTTAPPISGMSPVFRCQLFFDVTAAKAATSWVTLLLPHCGQATPPFSRSAM